MALERNPALIRGARVLDVGCGTGILSMFAARAGAAAVVALDGSERIAGFAARNATANGLSADAGGPIHVVASKVEEVREEGQGGATLLGHGQVDVIVSEWMGYALLFESMLDSVSMWWGWGGVAGGAGRESAVRGGILEGWFMAGCCEPDIKLG